MDDGAHRPGYDEVRRRLIERGYLQGPLERFLLRDLMVRPSAWRAVAVSAAKAALLGAPLLAAVLAWATVAANRPLYRGADAGWLWLYFAALSLPLLFALDLGAGWLLAGLARRAGRTGGHALRVLLIVGVPVVAYLGLLWWRGGGRRSIVGDAAFLILAVVVAGALVWLARLVSLAAIVGRTGQVPERRRGLATIVLLVLAPLAAVFLVLPEAGAGGVEARAADVFEIVPRDERLWVLGIDGLDGELTASLAGNPAVDRLLDRMAEGAVFPIPRGSVRDPAELWTTLLTGMSVEEHGVRDIGAERLPGVATPLRRQGGPRTLAAAVKLLLPTRTVPTTAGIRRVRTAWEILGLKQPSVAVGWWASWPAEPGPLGGYVVTDRVLAKLLSGADADRDTAPDSLYARLAGTFPESRDRWRRELDEAASRVTDPRIRDWWWESHLIDAFALETAGELAGDPNVRAVFVYLPGLDILRRRIADGPGEAGADLVERQRALEGYVAGLAARIDAHLTARAGDRHVLVADPGRSAGPGSEGWLLVLAPGARPGCVGSALRDLQIAPRILEVAGFPPSDEMSGAAAGPCLDPGDLPRGPGSFGRRAPSGTTLRSDYDPELIERLRSLGYLR